uniref:Transcription factor TFIIIC triple barrel domain-containing protein n=1 Tax=Ditylenchus dipsaci TaxID=166011 RepID=A0A915DDP9_9BILA
MVTSRISRSSKKTEEILDETPQMASTSAEETSTEEESEYEEEIMVIELNGVLDAESVRQAARNGLITLRRANGSEPLVQVGSAMYTGQWAQTLGTDLIFCTSDKVVHEGSGLTANPTANPFPTSTNEDIGLDLWHPIVLLCSTSRPASQRTSQLEMDNPELTQTVEDLIDVELSHPGNSSKKRPKGEN